MGMSTRIIGIKPANKKYKEMLKVYKSCVDARINIPVEVNEFFNYDNPEEKGVIVKLRNSVTKYNKDMEDGFEVDLDKLDGDIKIIRFVNSY